VNAPAVAGADQRLRAWDIAELRDFLAGLVGADRAEAVAWAALDHATAMAAGTPRGSR
jgi:hypothetical protein